MILISIEQVLNSKYSELIPIECDSCKKTFTRKQKFVKYELKNNRYKGNFCSRKCVGASLKTRIEKSCNNCGKVFLKRPFELKKSPNSFCSQSCAAIYSNAHKSHGYRRSKLEVYLEQALLKKYLNLEFLFNRKDIINSELDIYIPSLNLAFELNGIFHYEPIYGSEKLDQIKNNDSRKYQACIEKNIELCIIDSSGLKYFKPEKCQKYLDIITNIINIKLK
jgi:hypothetical protein